MLTEEQKHSILEAIKICSRTNVWVPLAKMLADAKDHGEDLTFADLKTKLGRLISAYRFLQVRRPDLLDTPEEIVCEYRAVACLPTLYGRLPEDGREERIEAILNKVLNKEIPTYVVERYATTLTDESKKIMDSYVLSTHLKKIEGYQEPPSEGTLEAVKAYKSGEINWISLTAVLIKAKDNGEDLTNLDFSYGHINKLIVAYRYLEVKKPNIILAPEQFKVMSITSLTKLASLSGKLPQVVLDNYLEKVLSGKATEDEIVEIAKGVKTEITEEKVPFKGRQLALFKPMETKEEEWFLNALHFISDTVDLIIQKHGHDAIRERHAKICDDLATKFRCIADPGYKKQWDERKEGSL